MGKTMMQQETAFIWPEQYEGMKQLPGMLPAGIMMTVNKGRRLQKAKTM